ncbi:MAG: glycosyltransferase family 2 protein [bacterium]|nr:glycosyltransferase family 2 protein [bacterium]
MLLAYLLFFLGLGLLVYTYLIYPGFILLLGSRKEKDYARRWSEPPSVTILLAVHNEAAIIVDKLQNALAQDYPADKLDLLVVDDLSTDRTLEMIKSIPGDRITCIEQKERLGKTAAMNQAVVQARGDILVFTDAKTFFQPDAVRKLIETFDANQKIGVVCGEMRYVKHPDAVSDEESHYWNFERRLRRAESRTGTLLGAHGPMYAIPRELFTPLSEDLISDFMTPLLLALQGYRTVNQPAAVATQCGTSKSTSIFYRKRRIIQRSLYAIWKNRQLINPFKAKWLAVQLWSHKVLRWFTALWFIFIAIGSFLLRDHLFFNYFGWCQIVGYGAGLIGLLVQSAGKPAVFLRFPAYVLMILGASLVGMLRFFTGKKVVTWEPLR